ncbi:hypothetical protein [Clostridium sp. ZS2-4]|uniref:hypothetical protein n=1 Tax=Clostridium sp. ZS2-4 TaxID=2987703 RepID=UPI00227B296E|nr:hypothetical protein [Clostridium sp. ZS2-4]MCY6356658.1 hypothetical protein [Clostridium sp. ZS2-4]
MCKLCILNPKKVCDNCDECNKCDLKPSKICNNCGKCLELEGYDAKAIDIDEIVEDVLEINDKEDENTSKNQVIEKFASYNSDLKEDDIRVEYIDDIDGLTEILEENMNTKKVMEEAFPGLFVFDNRKE